MKTTTLILAFCFTSWGIIAQSTVQDSLIKQAWVYFEKSEAVLEQSLDSCIYYTDLASQLFKEAEDWKWHTIMIGAIGNVNYMKGREEEAKKYYDQAIAIARERLPEIPYFIVNGYAILYYKARGQYDEAIELFYEALDLLEKNNGKAQLRANILENIGFTFLQKGDLVQAEKYLRQSLLIKQQEFGVRDISTIQNANKLASCYREAGQVQKAIGLLKKNLLYLNDRSRGGDYPDSRRIEVYTQLGDIYLSKEQLDSSRFFVQKALALQPSDESLEKNFSYLILGELSLLEKDAEQAIQYFEENVRLSLLENKDFPYHVDIAEGYQHLAKAYAEQSKPEQALAHYQKSLMALCPTQPELGRLGNPDPALFISPDRGLEVLKAKAQYLQSLSSAPGQEAYATAALETYQAAIAAVRQVRKSYSSEKAKLLLGKEVATIFEAAMVLTWNLYEATGDDRFTKDLYALIEGNRANLLLENVQDEILQGQGILPDSIVHYEYSLISEITYYLRKIQAAELSSEESPEALPYWKAEHAKLEQAYDALQSQIAQDYPAYYDLKHDYEQVSLASLQEALPNQRAALVQYFIGENNSFAVFVTKSNLQIYSLDCQSGTLPQIEALRTIVTTYPTSDQYANQKQEFARLGRELYQLLLSPLAESNYDQIEELIIIPDGQLHFLPFELLLSAEAADNLDFSLNTFEYLMKRYAISYAYSGSLFYHNQTTPRSEIDKQWVGFAPSFNGANVIAERSCQINELYSLTCNQQEVTDIQAILGKGEVFLGTEASKENFERTIADYSILHLATHACVDLAANEQSRIFFSNDYFTTIELNPLRINADLVVLSACNTGAGQLIEGEGVLSMARSFTLAGVASTVTSLWSVDDCTTSSVMKEFYNQLSQGKSKSVALQQAKIAHLESTEKLYQHPYFWAAFLHYGEPAAIPYFKQKKWSYALIIGSIGLIILAFLFFKRLQRASEI